MGGRFKTGQDVGGCWPRDETGGTAMTDRVDEREYSLCLTRYSLTISAGSITAATHCLTPSIDNNRARLY